MIKVKREGVILRPTSQPFETKAVLNPGVVQEGNDVHVVYRAINDDFLSCFGYARLDGPLKVAERWKEPFMLPKTKLESKGIEDPRIVKIDGHYFMTYIAHDGKNALISLAHGNNLFKLKRSGIISPKITYDKAGQLFKYSRLKDDYYFFESFYKEYAGRNVLVWNKDSFFFPERIKNKLAFVHRILPDTQIAFAEDIWQLKDRYFWMDYLMNLSKYVILEGEYGWEKRHVGGGCPPIKTRHGWLMIYHGTEENNHGRVYHAGAALYDKKNPQKLIARLPYPLFSPKTDYELHGHVNRVVFPTGTSFFREKLYIYYGAADKHIAVVSVKLDDLIDELLNYRIKK